MYTRKSTYESTHIGLQIAAKRAWRTLIVYDRIQFVVECTISVLQGLLYEILKLRWNLKDAISKLWTFIANCQAYAWHTSSDNWSEWWLISTFRCLDSSQYNTWPIVPQFHTAGHTHRIIRLTRKMHHLCAQAFPSYLHEYRITILQLHLITFVFIVIVVDLNGYKRKQTCVIPQGCEVDMSYLTSNDVMCLCVQVCTY